MVVGFHEFHVKVVFIIEWCPISIDHTRFNHMCYFRNRYQAYRCITIIEGAHFTYLSVSW